MHFVTNRSVASTKFYLGTDNLFHSKTLCINRERPKSHITDNWIGQYIGCRYAYFSYTVISKNSRGNQYKCL